MASHEEYRPREDDTGESREKEGRDGRQRREEGRGNRKGNERRKGRGDDGVKRIEKGADVMRWRRKRKRGEGRERILETSKGERTEDERTITTMCPISYCHVA